MKEQLLQATFKGAAFYWRSLTTELGKSSISHRYPGSPRRFVEDMGRLPNTFSIEAVIGGGDAYTANKQALENAISSPGAGWLVHPTYGRVLCTAKPATCRESLKTIGQANYTLKFERHYDSPRPETTGPTARKVNLLSQQSLSQLAETSAENYKIPKSPAFYEKAVDQLNEISDQLENATLSFSAKQNASRNIVDSIRRFKRNVNDYVSAPHDMFKNIEDIFNELATLDDGLLDRLGRFTSMFGKTSDAPAGQAMTPASRIPPISYESEEAESNRRLLQENLNTGALTQAYKTISEITFTDEKTLDESVERLESHFEIMSNAHIMTFPLRDIVIDMRITSNRLIQKQRLTTSKIVDTHLKVKTPLMVVLYRHSGSIDNSDYMQGLNFEKSQSFAIGNVEVLE